MDAAVANFNFPCSVEGADRFFEGLLAAAEGGADGFGGGFVVDREVAVF